MSQKTANISKLRSIQKSLGGTRIAIPIIIGALVISYMLWKNFSYQEFLKLSWNAKTILFLTITILVLIIRHLAYAWRLRIITENLFSWKKAVELIFIWEFSSAISPTALGGSATAMFFLSQEKLAIAKTVTVILYTVVLDTLFTVLSLTFFVLMIGPIVIHPDVSFENLFNGYGLSFFIVLGIMFTYGSIFFYALFIGPSKISRVLIMMSRIRFLKRFKEQLHQSSKDIISVSKELAQENVLFHLKAFLATSIAWICRFAILPLIIFGIVQSLDLSLYDFFLMTGRNESMFAITAISPTPGGSGVAEALFGNFFKDYVGESSAVIIAIIWRLIIYYTYLFAGVVIVPIWISNLILRRKKSIAEISD